jgi:hypothetical protein
MMFRRKEERSFGADGQIAPRPGGQKTLKALYCRSLVLVSAIAGKIRVPATTPDGGAWGDHNGGVMGRTTSTIP